MLQAEDAAAEAREVEPEAACRGTDRPSRRASAPGESISGPPVAHQADLRRRDSPARRSVDRPRRAPAGSWLTAPLRCAAARLGCRWGAESLAEVVGDDEARTIADRRSDRDRQRATARADRLRSSRPAGRRRAPPAPARRSGRRLCGSSPGRAPVLVDQLVGVEAEDLRVGAQEALRVGAGSAAPPSPRPRARARYLARILVRSAASWTRGPARSRASFRELPIRRRSWAARETAPAYFGARPRRGSRVHPDSWSHATRSQDGRSVQRLGLQIGLDASPLAALVRASPSACGGSVAAAKHPRQLRVPDQHLARLRALVAGDDAAALEHVDEAAGARVAHPQPALDHRDRGRARSRRRSARPRRAGRPGRARTRRRAPRAASSARASSSASSNSGSPWRAQWRRSWRSPPR